MIPPTWNVGWLDHPALGIIIHVLRERIIFMSPIWGSFLKLTRKSNLKGISVACVVINQVQPREFVSPNPTNMPVFQPCAFHIILLIYFFSFSMEDLPTTRIWLRFGSSPLSIIHITLSISDQLCCKIKLFYFWVHLDVIPTCVIVTNLYWPPIFQ